MNEKVKQAQETLLELSGLALKYLVNNFHYNSNEYANGKLEIGNLTDKLRLALNDFDRYYESQQDLIKGKDEYIAKLCNDRAELKEEIKRLDSQYKNIHNTKVKFPLCNIFSGLPQHEREKIIEDIYYSHTEQVEKLQNKNMELEEKYADTDIKAKRYEKFAQIVIKKNVDIFALKHAHKLDTIEQSLENYNTYKNDNEDELNQFEYAFLVGVVDEMRKKVVEKYGKR